MRSGYKHFKATTRGLDRKQRLPCSAVSVQYVLASQLSVTGSLELFELYRRAEIAGISESELLPERARVVTRA